MVEECEVLDFIQEALILQLLKVSLHSGKGRLYRPSVACQKLRATRENNSSRLRITDRTKLPRAMARKASQRE